MKKSLLSSNFHRSPKTRISGFTLLEVMIVVAIVGVISALAIPSYSRMVDSEQVEANSSQFARAVMESRSAAITTGIPVQMCPSSNSKTCSDNWSDGWLAYHDTNKNLALDKDELILFRHISSDDVIDIEVKALDGKARKSIRFNFRGFMDSVATVDLARNDKSQSLSLSVFGKPKKL